MKKKHKIGVHVSAQQRGNYGVAAPHLVSVCAFDPGAFDEIPNQAIKIFRTHGVPDHKDGPGDFDRLRDDQLAPAAKWWWREHLEPIFRKIKEQYGDNVYFQPTNEINNRRILLYLDGMIEAADRDGYKLALLGDAGDSPELDEWKKHWLPWLKKHDGKGHIYVRHAYSGVNPDDGSGKPSVYLTKENGEPSDNNTARPFIEAELMRKNGIAMPMVITELGWLAGWNSVPPEWLRDLLRYNDLMMAHDNIVGSCLWNAGQWETAPNILAGRPLLELGWQLRKMQPKFFNPAEHVVGIEPTPSPPLTPVDPKPEPTPADPDPIDHEPPAISFEQAIIRAIELARPVVNEDAALYKRMKADGYPHLMTGETGLVYAGKDYIVQGAMGDGGDELLAYFVPHGEWDKVDHIVYSIEIDDNELPSDDDEDVEGPVTPEPPKVDSVWDYPQPDGYLYGIDVSRYQKVIDFSKINPKCRYVIAKATDGNTWVDPQYENNILGAQSLGLVTGAYHYFRPNNRDPRVQAAHFVSVWQARPTDFWVVDVEEEMKVDNDPLYDRRLQIFINHVVDKIGLKPIIYTSDYKFTKLTTNPSWAKIYPLWAAHYAPNRKNPLIPRPWVNWALWQITSSDYEMIGVRCDVNRFRGSAADLRLLAQSLKVEKPQPISVPKPVTPEYDIMKYMAPGKEPFGVPYEMWHSGGSQSNMQTQYDPDTGRHYHVKGDRHQGAEWEAFFVKNGTIYRTTDCSPGDGRMYTMYEDGKVGAPWCPAKMRIGQSFTRTAQIQWAKKDGTPLGPMQTVTDTITLVAFHPVLEGKNGVKAYNVIELAWDKGEHYFYGEVDDSKGNRVVAGLVAWGRQHNDPHTPGWSIISEVHSLGERINSKRQPVVVREAITHAA